MYLEYVGSVYHFYMYELYHFFTTLAAEFCMIVYVLKF